MGLVELLVWMAISLLIISVARFVVYLLDRDIRMAGFRGCNGAAVTPVNVLNSTAYPYQFDVGIAGYHGTSGAWSPALPTAVSALTPAPLAGTDVVTIRHIDGTGIPLTAAMSNSSADIQVAPGSSLSANDVLLVADCSASAIFSASDVNAGSGEVKHDTGGSTSPGNTTRDLATAFRTEASVYRLVTRTYYVAPSVRKPGTNALWANSVPAYSGQAQPEEMVEGVEGVVLFFGEDLDGDRAANRYVSADAVGTWSNVVSVKAQLLLATVRDNTTTAPQAYTFNGVSTTPTDRRLRSVLSSVITVRNRVP